MLQVLKLVYQVFLRSLLTLLNAWLVHQAELEASERYIHRRRQREPRDRGHALREVRNISDSIFLKMFRMTRRGFVKLLAMIEPYMQDINGEMADRSTDAGAISNETKLYVTLRWLAGGSYLDLAFAWGISIASFYAEDGVIWPTIHAIDTALTIGLAMDDHTELNDLAVEFAKYSHGELPGCVLAVDGWVARTRKPFVTETTDIMAYRNRHDCWGLVVLAGCDAHCKFHMFNVANSGSTHDSLAWEMSTMKLLLETGRLPRQYFFVADEAFTNTNQLLVPYSGHGLGPWKDSFNYHLSVMRQCIERAFALLTQRWGILWRPIRCDFARWPTLLTVLAKLHNYCIDNDIPICVNRYYEDYEEGDDVVVFDNNEDEEGVHNRRAASGDRRRSFTQDLCDKGVRRPDHAAVNARE